MKKANILPSLAINSIIKNKKVYLPYIIASALCVSTFFIFVSIRNNKIMDSLPYTTYIYALMIVGEFLLAVILTPFLISINKFLIKQRKKELGLYCVLGLEKKHIGIMLLIENILLFLIISIVALITASIFSKLIFMLLMKITNLPVDTSFSFSFEALIETLIFYFAISVINYFVNLSNVSKANPAELFLQSKQGEKEPKSLVVSTILGLLCLGGGYFIALKSTVNAFIYFDFAFAVTLVIIGTYLLFKSISVSFLRLCKKNKKLYYKSKNFITISGMLFRMRKNSSGLSNICIFGTMTIITLICTTVVFFGKNAAIDFNYPYDYSYFFTGNDISYADDIKNEILSTAKDNDVEITNLIDYRYGKMYTYPVNDTFLNIKDIEKQKVNNGYYSAYRVMSVDEYNRCNNSNVKLAEDEVMIFLPSSDYEYDNAMIAGLKYKVTKLDSIPFGNKNKMALYSDQKYIIFPNEALAMQCADYYKEDVTKIYYAIRFNVSDITNQNFRTTIKNYVEQNANYSDSDDKFDWQTEANMMYGGLLFLGIFFGLIFLICMVLIMYYKQITEGYEDRKSFEIMQNVGMSKKEVRITVRKQIQIFFFLPLLATVCHTAVALNIVSNLMATLNIFSLPLIFICAGATVVVFTAVYWMAYNVTARAYYQIVR